MTVKTRDRGVDLAISERRPIGLVNLLDIYTVCHTVVYLERANNAPVVRKNEPIGESHGGRRGRGWDQIGEHRGGGADHEVVSQISYSIGFSGGRPLPFAIP
jgi:hypothetical protein